MEKDGSFDKGFLQGDPEVLSTLYTHVFPSTKSYILRGGGSEKDAEDIFHDALVLIFVKLKNEELEIRSLDKYLFTVCRNMWRKKCSAKRVTTSKLEPLMAEEIDKASFYIEQRQWELYKEKFQQLSAQCKEILQMLLQKKTYAEIVDRFEYSSALVARQRVFKCKAKLIGMIKGDPRYNHLKD